MNGIFQKKIQIIVLLCSCSEYEPKEPRIATNQSISWCRKAVASETLKSMIENEIWQKVMKIFISWFGGLFSFCFSSPACNEWLWKELLRMHLKILGHARHMGEQNRVLNDQHLLHQGAGIGERVLWPGAVTTGWNAWCLQARCWLWWSLTYLKYLRFWAERLQTRPCWCH